MGQKSMTSYGCAEGRRTFFSGSRDRRTETRKVIRPATVGGVLVALWAGLTVTAVVQTLGWYVLLLQAGWITVLALPFVILCVVLARQERTCRKNQGYESPTKGT